MKPIKVPTTDVNSENGYVVAWNAKSRDQVNKGDLLLEVETSKEIIEVAASDTGFLLRLCEESEDFSLSKPVGLVFPSLSALEAYNEKSDEEAETPTDVRATEKAKVRATELGIDLQSLNTGGLITVKQVEAAAENRSAPELPAPLSAESERVVILGGGLGAQQVIDIFCDSEQAPVAILDDDERKWAKEICGIPVCGGTSRLKELFRDGLVDSAIIAISKSVEIRAKLRRLCEETGIPLANAIDRTAKLASNTALGQGNVICAFVQLGAGTVIGDNNFLSAYNSFDHHNVLGNDISTGPGCMTSGRVKIGDRCRLGTGIFIEPGIELGEEVKVASGAILVKNVPAQHSVKRKIVTTSVVPNR